jgi:hypothetical protein
LLSNDTLEQLGPPLERNEVPMLVGAMDNAGECPVLFGSEPDLIEAR